MTESVWTPGPEGSSSHESAPLTRREIRAREQTAALASELAAAPAPRAMTVPPQTPAPQAMPAQAPAPHMTAAPAEPQSTFASLFEASSAVDSPFDFGASDAATSRRGRAPKKPKAFRPVRPPRGTSRPRSAAPASVRLVAAPANRKPFKRRVLKKLMTFSAMIGAGLMMVATTVPANAFYSNASEVATGAAPAVVQSQRISVAPTADLTLTRDGYTVTSLREQIFLKYGNRSFLYTNNPNGTIQWPFPIAVPISDPYGWRLDPCSICVPFHKGVDFTPGLGTMIQAIADGVVTEVGEAHWGLGNHVIIDHVVSGKHIQSVYAHMQDGTMRMVVGQQVKVGDPVGQVGSTGESTGPHLHFEIHVNGAPVDPFEWLKANAN